MASPRGQISVVSVAGLVLLAVAAACGSDDEPDGIGEAGGQGGGQGGAAGEDTGGDDAGGASVGGASGAGAAGKGGGGSGGEGGCGDVDYLGKCEGDVLVWCERGMLMTHDCAADGKTCGWQDDRVGYNCIG